MYGFLLLLFFFTVIKIKCSLQWWESESWSSHLLPTKCYTLLYSCMYVCMYVRTHARTYARTHVCMYTCIDELICLNDFRIFLLFFGAFWLKLRIISFATLKPRPVQSRWIKKQQQHILNMNKEVPQSKVQKVPQKVSRWAFQVD